MLYLPLRLNIYHTLIYLLIYLTWIWPGDDPAPPENLKLEPVTELFPAVMLTRSLILAARLVFPEMLGKTTLPGAFVSLQHTSTSALQC